MRLSPLLAALALLVGTASAQPASRLFLVPTARPAPDRVAVGARFFIPSVEARVSRGVSLGVTGLVLPRDGGGIRGGGIADVRVTLHDGSRSAVAVGVTGSATYSSGDAYGDVPASAHVYAVGTVGGKRESATLGLGVRAQGGNEYDAPDCPMCGGWVSGPPTYRLRLRQRPVIFGGAEAKVGESGAFRYRVVGEGLALPTAGDRYTTLAGGGLRIEHKAVRLDVGAMVLSDAWGRTDRVTEPGPWVALSAGF